MGLEIILAASRQKNGDLGIGLNGCIPWNIPEDLKHFKEITMGHTVIMGKATFDSISKALPGRKCVVLTSNLNFEMDGVETVCSFEAIDLIIGRETSCNKKVFIIGGKVLYEKYLKQANVIHLTHIENEILCDTLVSGGIPGKFNKIQNYSELKEINGIRYRFLTYSQTFDKLDEQRYLDLLEKILEKGSIKKDRTGTGTISIFGDQLRFDISDGKIPMLTTKKLPFKTILEELLWFCRGDTNSMILSKKGIKIWNGNTSREFLDSRNLDYDEGIAGPIYGFQWKHFGAKYSPEYSDTSKIDTSIIGGMDQLQNVINILKTDPFSRRIVMSAWNPGQLDEMCLPPCHFSIVFSVHEEYGEKYLSSHFIMRSTDVFLGMPFNIASYTILTQIIAMKCGMKADELVFSGSDIHIYNDHILAIKKQLGRQVRAPPILKINDCIKDKDWSEMKVEDFDLIGYIPSQGIIAKMAI